MRGRLQDATNDALKERLYSRTHTDPQNGCVVFCGPLDKDGYGVPRMFTKRVKAHRLAWLVHFGEIPPGLCVCHKCDVRNCINPAHLFLGTQSENTRDRHAKGRTASGDRSGSRMHPETRPRGDSHFARQHPETRQGEKNGNAKLTERDVVLIRRLTGFLFHSEITTIFNVGRSTISSVINRKTWPTVIDQ